MSPLANLYRSFGMLIVALKQAASERRHLSRKLCFELAYNRVLCGSPGRLARLDRHHPNFWSNRPCTYLYKHENFQNNFQPNNFHNNIRMFHQHFHGRRYGGGGGSRRYRCRRGGHFFSRRRLASLKHWFLGTRPAARGDRPSVVRSRLSHIPKIGVATALRFLGSSHYDLSNRDLSASADSILLENKRTTSNLVGYSSLISSNTSTPGRYDNLLFATRPSELIWRGNAGAAFYSSISDLTTSPLCLEQRARNLFQNQNQVFQWNMDLRARHPVMQQTCQSLFTIKRWIKEQLASLAAFAIPQDTGVCRIYRDACLAHNEGQQEVQHEKHQYNIQNNGIVSSDSSLEANATSDAVAMSSLGSPLSSSLESSASSSGISSGPSLAPQPHASSTPTLDVEVPLTPLESSAVEFDLRPRLNLPSVGELNDETVHALQQAIRTYIGYMEQISADIERVSNLGELPISIENGVVKIHFPNADTLKVNALLSDVEVTAGIVSDTSTEDDSLSMSSSSSSGSDNQAGVVSSDSGSWGMSSILSSGSSLSIADVASVWPSDKVPSLTNSASSLDADSEAASELLLV